MLLSVRRLAPIVVALVVALVPCAVGLSSVLPLLTDRQPPVVDLGDVVADDRFDAAAWDAATVTDERVVAGVRVAGCGVERVQRPDAPLVVLGEVVPGATLAARLSPGACTLSVEAWDGPLGPVAVERRDLVVYPGGAVLAADGVRADGSPPAIEATASGAVVRDDLSGVASVEVRTRCVGGWSVAWRRAWPELARRIVLPALLPDLGATLPWTGAPATCEGRVVAVDHAGRSAEVAVRWLRLADVALPEAAVLADLVPPALEGVGPAPLASFVLTDATGLRRVEPTLTCGDGVPVALPPQEYLARTARLPVSSLVPARLPPGRCVLALAVTDHAGRSASLELDLLVGDDGSAVARPPAGDREPPRLLGLLRTMGDLEAASWFDGAPGVVAVYGRVSCGREAPVELVPARIDPPGRRAPALSAPLPLPPGRCEVTLAAVDGEGLSGSASLAFFRYRDGTVVPADRLDEADEPELLGWDAASADGRVTAEEWATVALVDEGAGLAEVRVGLDCPRRDSAPASDRWNGPERAVPLSDLLPDPAATSDGRRCGVVLFAADHAGNVLVETLDRARFR